MKKNKMVQLSIFVSLASVLQIVESMFPAILPGFKIGLANIFTILVIYKYSWKDAVLVSILRSVATSFILGTFLSPGFFIGISGAITSSMMMSFAYLFIRQFSIYGVSIIGAITNNLTQIVVVYFLFVKSVYVLWLLPFMLVGSVVSGVITGYFAKKALGVIKKI